MIAEVVLLFDGLLREARPLRELLASDSAHLDGRLAGLYGIDPALIEDPERMQRVVLPDPRRGGVLTSAAVLTLTSAPQRTSSVLRGKWILDNLLGDPPAAPPPTRAWTGSLRPRALRSDRPLARGRRRASRRSPAG
jgi:hypothetical protein